jgi:hypothetical protein
MGSYFSDLLQFIKEVLSRWPELAMGGGIGLAWLVLEKCIGRPVSMKVFFAILGTALFLATFHAWRDQYLKSRSSLVMSVFNYGFDAVTSELFADLQFTNKGTIRRTILGVRFTYRSKGEDGQSQNVFVKPNDLHPGLYDHSSPPIYAESNQPEMRTYRFTLSGDQIGLTSKPGEIFGLQVVSLKPDGDMTFTTVEAMEAVEYDFAGQRGVALITLGKRNISLDSTSYSKMEDQAMLPLPTPNKEVSPR